MRVMVAAAGTAPGPRLGTGDTAARRTLEAATPRLQLSGTMQISHENLHPCSTPPCSTPPAVTIHHITKVTIPAPHCSGHVTGATGVRPPPCGRSASCEAVSGYLDV